MLSFYRSTIGKKFVVATTGLVMFGFVVGHLAGNLQIFAGAQKINDYAAFLKATPPVLWGTRIVLLLAIVLHVIATVQLSRRNRRGRPVGYAQKRNDDSPFASRVMLVSGVVLLAYIVYHLLHLTFGWVHPDFDEFDIYGNMVSGFSNPLTVAFYVAGLLSLGLHLVHGVWSVFQTLGLNHPAYNPWRRRFAYAAAVLVTAGYIAIPVAVLAGVVR